MPKLSVNCTFKSNKRLFKVVTMGAAKGELCWWIQEVHQVVHDRVKHIEPISELFSRSQKEMELLVDSGTIEVL